MSLSWGTAALAADLAMPHPDRRAAVIGCGIIGLTTARTLQRRGFDVTIYAASLPPDTTSNMSFATFTPTSSLISLSRRTPEWDAQFRQAVEIAYRQHQLLAGSRFGVSWIDHYSPTNSENVIAGRSGGPGPESAMLPPGTEPGWEVLREGEHPFGARFARRHPTLRFDPSLYLDALMHDVIAFGGAIRVRSFDTPRDMAALSETIIVNCTGLGSRALFGDDELTPIKGQLVMLVPQPEITWSLATMVSRTDGIALGHVMQRGVWSLEVDDAERRRVIEYHQRIFGGMRGAVGGEVPPESRGPVQPPPVEWFFGMQS